MIVAASVRRPPPATRHTPLQPPPPLASWLLYSGNPTARKSDARAAHLHASFFFAGATQSSFEAMPEKLPRHPNGALHAWGQSQSVL